MLARWLPVMLLMVPTRRAAAFDYPEHAHISHAAIQLALERDPRTKAVLETVPSALNSSRLCKGADLFENEAPLACFALSDLPALSGDHAASPALLKWRWFNDCTAPHERDSVIDEALRIIGGLGRATQSPEQVLLKAPRVIEMLRVVRGVRPQVWPLATPPSDTDFLAADDAYVTLGERGRPHFRPALSAPSMALAEERSAQPSEKPADQAFAWYADLHAGALMFARHAGNSAHREFFQGLAIILEFSALHYLEDSVAAGHMVPERWMNNGSRMATHNLYSSQGIVAKPNRQLCTFSETPRCVVARPGAPRLPALRAACVAHAPVRLLGDHELSRRTPTEPDITFDWAVAVTAKSILEVVQAATTGEARSSEIDTALESCGTTPIATGPEYTWDTDRGACGGPSDSNPGPDQQLYRCLYRWWEGAEFASRVSINHLTQIETAFPNLESSALGMVPVPLVDGRGVPGDDECENGNCAELRRRARNTYPSTLFFSGGGADLQGLTEYHTKDRKAEPGASFGVRLVVPRSLAGVEVGLATAFVFAVTSDTAPLRSADLMLNGRWLPFHSFFLSLTGRAGVAHRDDPLYHARLGGAGGLGFVVASKTYFEWVLFTEFGYAGITQSTWSTGTGITF